MAEERLKGEYDAANLKTMTKPDWAEVVGRDKYGRFTDIEIKDVRQRMRWIEPGSFLMGSPDEEAERYNDEIQHNVQITQGYWLADTACTHELWEAVMGVNSLTAENDTYPITHVSWYDARIFCEKLSQITGKKYSLPTEAQWEYACRAGSKTGYCFGPDEKELKDYGWYNKNANNASHSVGGKKPNKYGLYDMHGNVWEWCSDWFAEYNEDDQVDPLGPDEGETRILRGGSWLESAGNCRCAYRFHGDPGLYYYYIGFRFSMCK